MKILKLRKSAQVQLVKLFFIRTFTKVNPWKLGNEPVIARINLFN